MSDLIRDVAARYDDEGDGRLEAATLARLRWRARHGGKRCSSCGQSLPVSAFGRDSTREDGLRRYCRTCRSAGVG